MECFEWKVHETTFFTQEAAGLQEVRVVHTRGGLPRRARSPGPGELSPARGCGGGGGSSPRHQGRTRGPIPPALGALGNGGGEIRERAGGQINTFRIRRSPPTSPTSRSARQALSPTAPHPIPPPGPRLGPVVSQSEGWVGVRRARGGAKVRTQNTNRPLAETTKCVYTCKEHSPVTGLRTGLRRAQLPTLLFFLIKSITLPSGADWEGTERKRGECGESGGEQQSTL